MASKKEKRHAVRYVLDLAQSVRCENLHHPKKLQHKYDEGCGAEYYRARQIYLVSEMIKELKL